VERLALGLEHVGGDGALVAVLPAADVEKIMRGRVDGLALPGAVVDEADPRHSQRRCRKRMLPRSA